MAIPNLSALAVRERAVTLFFIILIGLAGLSAFMSLGRAEDPAFTIRVMMVSATWPGATAKEMQEQVAARLEKRIQEVEYFKRVITTARPGRVDMQIEFEDYAPGDMVPQLFYETRKRMQDEAPHMPPGVTGPIVNDDFSDVYFSLYALTAPELPPRLLAREAEVIRDRLARVEGVRKVDLLGERAERIFIEFDNTRIVNLGISMPAVLDAVDAQNQLAAAGYIETQGPRSYLRLTNGPTNPDTLRELPIRVEGRLLHLGDIAEIRRGYEDPPSYLVRASGEDAVLLGVVMGRGENGLDLGARLDDFTEAEKARLPLGLTLHQLTNQADAISEAVNLFQVKFFVAVAVVTLVCFLAIGWRAGIIVAITIPLTLALTFLLMRATDINLDRITLGALIIALGLLVDDAIIAIEMMLVKMEQGWERIEAAAHAWKVAAAPMLFGTLVTVAGFVPIGFAESAVGEFAGNIFWVLAYALLVSWLVAVIFTPYLGVKLLPDIARPHAQHDPYDSPRYVRLRRWIGLCVRRRKTVVFGTLGLLVLAALLMAATVQQQFFPSSDRPEVLVDIYMPEGTAMERTDEVTRRIEALLRDMPGVKTLSAYVGAGAPRFFLALNPEQPNPAFAKIIAVAHDSEQRRAIEAALQARVDAGEFPEARVRVHHLLFGPPVVWPVSFRISGPDLVTLRHIAERVRAVAADTPHVSQAHLEWGERAPVIRLQMDPDRLRLLNLTPRDVAQQFQFELDGLPVTHVREDIRSVEVRARGLPSAQPPSLRDMEIKTMDGRKIPVAQLGEVVIEYEDPVLKGYNREPFIAVNAEIDGAQAINVTHAVWDALHQVRADLPEGYQIEIGGSVESSSEADASIQKMQPIMVALMLIFIMLQMRSFSGTFVVMATAPLGVIGAVLALLLFNQPFGFVALLGLIGLAGILMRNTLILTQQVTDNVNHGMTMLDAVIEAAVRRARPVVLTALAAALAFIPLATDPFWGPLAYVLIGGVLVGTLITLLFVPALYALLFRLPRPSPPQ
ncbi:acriflavin resistance protein [Isoalcanivorax pacificus W11-5]|jgi:multidrug efflux pump subunit AcrB|uniref:Acriflavin resistance protein n=1 Tax=Isoalcanivorax pacificus W11-5 TaxID=391936 RepID=A0A0B4XMK4_9GAMM|nr:efflux RND transporter permease subunit [Isoalcanivorax pacificus]AJD48351.1 acriflavin resistance protein [Isoalcanivorax pacificus W11-5]